MNYVIISPCRNEAQYMRRTLDSVIRQTLRPRKWVIVDDGSSDDTPNILREYRQRHDWITVVTRPDRGRRKVGPGVIEAFYAGLETIDLDEYEYLCKLDLDLDLPPRYFETLVERMRANPRIGTCSGKPYELRNNRHVSDDYGDEMSVGASKFYRIDCFREIGGFVRQVMWDAIDCHKCRQLGWIACSWDAPELRFEHLRPEGSSERNILTGRKRHGFGQYYMGTAFPFMLASSLYRMAFPPYFLGGLYMLLGYLQSGLLRKPRHPDPQLRRFIRRYQYHALLKGKRRTIAEIDQRQAAVWARRHAEHG